MSRLYVGKTGSDLADLAAAGDVDAQAEIDYRKAKRALKGAGQQGDSSSSAPRPSAAPASLEVQVGHLTLQVERLTAQVLCLEAQMALLQGEPENEEDEGNDNDGDFSRA